MKKSNELGALGASWASVAQAICLGILRVCIALSFVLSFSAQGKNLSGWVTPWDDQKSLDHVFENASELDVIWTMGLQYDGQGKFSYDEPSAVTEWLKKEPSRQTKFGPVLHNMRDGAFDSALGDDLLKHRSKAIAALKVLAKKHGWTALNVDIESLDQRTASRYETFLSALHKGLPESEISVDLHAKTSDPGSYAGSHFQRWKQLSRLPVRFVVMAYDHTWSTSDPGPVAPLSWIRKVVTHADKFLPRGRTVIALPQYGYHWRRVNGKWQGKPFLTPELAAMIDKRWQGDAAVVGSDGRGYTLGEEAIYFDDAASFLLKASALRESSYHQLAVWRLAGTDHSFFSEWRKLK